ncbi:MAG: class I SAM-dependent methyltransferase [Coprothermobacterota bacterium]|jgi:demethylmenaquinone methyltransferase/2-methoxy-6-polyprenyl-1,4-benzoquinol methylase|nr:class I SAM-dependent methyltransferase [Coprothermobacterota bacterium]
MDSRLVYGFLAKFYDLFDLIFLLGGKGNSRFGLLEVISNPPQRILDVCVGTAASSVVVASRNTENHILGIDISDEMLAMARRKIARKKLTNLEVQNLSATAMRFPDNHFDVVMVSFALHEFEKEQREQVFQEISRVLKAGGTFCLIDFARQRNRRNRVFLRVWTLLEPRCFSEFLGIDWSVHLKAYGLFLEGEREFSFSTLYQWRKE